MQKSRARQFRDSIRSPDSPATKRRNSAQELGQAANTSNSNNSDDDNGDLLLMPYSTRPFVKLLTSVISWNPKTNL